MKSESEGFDSVCVIWWLIIICLRGKQNSTFIYTEKFTLNNMMKGKGAL